MATILNIDTSTTACSAALTAEGMILIHRETFEPQQHAALISDFIKDCLDHAADHEMKVDAVAVTLGPGSYT
ncbi:MAG: tRNA (adenosine(37)-N6)-threonylcarbamoyltransferase complex dimerization subunit type 1 TsaB, partial [Paramuribaculum sp.]|nr:tRNA (adenosine(37)-N6)-threonylcarbamoyltransferase complex dimerization subunit type 1 TsaB [Paramuribaculum sp.]